MLGIQGLLRSLVLAGAVAASGASAAGPDEFRNVKRGEKVPAFTFRTSAGAEVNSEELLGSTVVIVCLSAEQRRSELAAIDSFDVWKELGRDDVQLIHLTADAAHGSYFEVFRAEHLIDVPLALDSDRSFSGRLPLIVLPTTIVIDDQGRLAHTIVLHGRRYAGTLGAYIRHATGDLTDEQLAERLESEAVREESQSSRASAHRALARSMRERGQYAAAREEFLKARERQPDDEQIVLDLADLDIAMGSLDSATMLVDEVLAVDPEDRRGLLLKGILLFSAGELGEAERVLRRSLRLNPRPERVHYYLGRILETRGETDEALRHYRESARKLLDEPE